MQSLLSFVAMILVLFGVATLQFGSRGSDDHTAKKRPATP
jgi:hypothetical protein